MKSIQQLLFVAMAGLMCVAMTHAAEPQQPASGLDLDKVLEHPEAWTPKIDRLRPTVQSTETHGTPQALCFEFPTDLGTFQEDLFSSPQCPFVNVPLPKDVDLSRFTRLTVWAKVSGRRATFINVGLQDAKNLSVMCQMPIDRGPWRQYTLNFHHLSPVQRQSLRYLFLQATCIGNQPDEEPLTRIYLDNWSLSDPPQRKFTGWGADPDVITVSQAGFRRFSEKMAMVPEACADAEFAVHDAATDKIVFTGKIQTIEGPLGRYKVARFDKFSQPGRYRVSAGPFRSLHFRIADDVFAEPLNFIYSWMRDMRCGRTTRLHMPCHLDDAILKGKHYDVSGGWHDAGDVRTYWFHSAEVPITALRLYGLGLRHDDDGDGRDDFLDDAAWGASHLIKVYDALGWFPNKIRDWPDYRRGNYWTDNKIGTADDRYVTDAPFYLTTEADVLALAALYASACPKENRPQAERLLAIARERFEHFWGDGKWKDEKLGSQPAYHKSHWVRGMLGMYLATHDKRYLEPLESYARFIVGCQKHEWPLGATKPLCGEIPSCGGNSNLPEEALALLCDALPEHPDWYEWHFALVRSMEHWHKPIRTFWQPFSLPHVEQAGQPGVGVRMIEAGANSRYVVPSGNCCNLPETPPSLMRVARVLNDPKIENLATWQVQWSLGHNPFNLSFVVDYGEDCVTQAYSFSQGRMPGAVTIEFGLEDPNGAKAPGMPRQVRPDTGEPCMKPGRTLVESLGDISSPAILQLQLLDGGKPYRGNAAIWWLRGEQEVQSLTTDENGRVPAVRLPGGEIYELRVAHAKGPFRLPLPMVSGNTYGRAIDLAGHLVLEAADAPANVDPERPFVVVLTVKNLGYSPASGRVTAFANDCRLTSPKEQAVMVPGYGTQKVTWEFVSGTARRAYLSRFELDGDHKRGLDATGTIGWRP